MNRRRVKMHLYLHIHMHTLVPVFIPVFVPISVPAPEPVSVSSPATSCCWKYPVGGVLIIFGNQFVGKGRAGKSSTIRALRGETFDGAMTSTLGIRYAIGSTLYCSDAVLLCIRNPLFNGWGSCSEIQRVREALRDLPKRNVFVLCINVIIQNYSSYNNIFHNITI